MPETVSLAECKNYLIIRSGDPVSFSEFKMAIITINYYYNKFGIDKVLVDGRYRDEIPDSQLSREAGHYLAEQTKGKIKFAILITHDPSAHDLFKVTVDINGGVIEYFNCEKKALRWLGVYPN